MKPFYFPFTYATKPIVEALGICFKQISIYQALGNRVPDNLKKWSEDGVIELRIPALEDEEKIVLIMQDYQNWAKIHEGDKGIHLDFLKTQQETVPFFESTSTSQIKADIKQKMDEDIPVKEFDPLFSARLFLSLAQDFDVNDLESGQDLRSFEIEEQNLFKKIRGETKTGINGNGDTVMEILPDQRDFMIPERISAWTQLFHQDSQNHNFENSGVFITSSAAVFNEIISKTSDSEVIYCIENMAVDISRPVELSSWQNKLSEHLKQIVYESDKTTTFEILPPVRKKPGATEISLKLNMITNETLYGWIDEIYGNDIKKLGNGFGSGKVKNTVIGLMESRVNPLNK